jgi:hypothetical protein
VEIQQGLQITPPAGIEPIHDDGDRVEIIWQRQHSVSCDEASIDGISNPTPWISIGGASLFHWGTNNSHLRWKFHGGDGKSSAIRIAEQPDLHAQTADIALRYR